MSAEGERPTRRFLSRWGPSLKAKNKNPNKTKKNNREHQSKNGQLE